MFKTEAMREPMEDIDSLDANLPLEDALAKTGYGKFHFLLFLLLGLTYIAIAMEVTVVSFVIPGAKCDFRMTSQDAGILSAAPMLGITLGSFFWGFLADLGGRRLVLASSLLMGGVVGIVSSVAQYYVLFVMLRFLSGFALVGALSLCLPYLGEFQPLEKRKKILCWMEVAWTAGIIATPCLAWLIIPLDMRLETKHFTFDSWNAFVFASALPCILLGLWAMTFPESPKFLFEIGEHENTLKVLRKMYAMNTGRPENTFGVNFLEEIGMKEMGTTTEMVNKPKKKNIHSLLKDMGNITRVLMKKPHRKETFLTCFIAFCLTGSYYTLMIWFPELFTRFEAYAELNPGRSASVCEVSSVFVDQPGPCRREIDTRVYFNTVIVGLACIPTSIWLPTCVNKLGPKFFMLFCVVASGLVGMGMHFVISSSMNYLSSVQRCCLRPGRHGDVLRDFLHPEPLEQTVFSVAVSGLVGMGMYFVTSSTQNLVLSGIFEALTSLGVMTYLMVIAEIFPTNVRVMATGLAISFGRLGALLGNLSFGYLIDFNCPVAIATFSSILLGTAVACIFLPVKMETESKSHL